MKVLICTIFLFSVILQDAAYAHQGHDFISSNTAISIASKSVKQQTFKDFGYAVGKLDASWKSLNDANFHMLEVLDKTFIISATNSINDQVIYLEITKNGKVLGVKGTY
jgi:hypothetical protein